MPPPPKVGRGHGGAAAVGAGDRTAGPAGSLARGAGARARRRHRAEAPVPRRQRRARPASRCSRSTPRPTGAAAPARRPRWRAPGQPGAGRGQAERYKPLVEANAISKQEYVNAVAGAEAGRGRRGRRPRAAVQTAQINLGYASVTAPIAGRIGRALVTEGALVGQGEATQLALIQQIDPMYVNFTQSGGRGAAPAPGDGSGQAAARAGSRRRAGARGAGGRQRATPRPGKLLFSDLSVDRQLGPDHAARRGAQPERRCCCPACTCACGWSRRRPATRCCCRSRR